jgi:hypothetical protein
VGRAVSAETLEVCVNRTQALVNRTQALVNRTQVCVNLTQGLFGAAGVAESLTLEPPHAGELSQRATRLLATLRQGRETYQQCFVVRQGDALETHWLPYLVEDRTQGTMSYTDFLCHLHRNAAK